MRGRREKQLGAGDKPVTPLGATLRAWRQYNGGLSQTALAVAAGLGKNGRAHISKIEHGDIRRPEHATINAVAQAMGTSGAALEAFTQPPGWPPLAPTVLQPASGAVVSSAKAQPQLLPGSSDLQRQRSGTAELRKSAAAPVAATAATDPGTELGDLRAAVQAVQTAIQLQSEELRNVRRQNEESNEELSKLHLDILSLTTYLSQILSSRSAHTAKESVHRRRPVSSVYRTSWYKRHKQTSSGVAVPDDEANAAVDYAKTVMGDRSRTGHNLPAETMSKPIDLARRLRDLNNPPPSLDSLAKPTSEAVRPPSGAPAPARPAQLPEMSKPKGALVERPREGV